MGFNRRKMEDQRQQVAEKEAANRRATDPQILEDAERLIAAWNERQAARMPMLFSPTIGAAIACRPNAPFAELVRLSRTSIADEMREDYRQRVLGAVDRRACNYPVPAENPALQGVVMKRQGT